MIETTQPVCNTVHVPVLKDNFFIDWTFCEHCTPNFILRVEYDFLHFQSIFLIVKILNC